MQTYKVAISIPNESYIPVESYDNHLLLANHLGKLEKQWQHESRDKQYVFGWFTTGRLLTAFAREKLAENALKQGFDYLLMLDNDMLYPIDTVECMIKDFEENENIDVLAPLAFMRNPPHYAVMYITNSGYDPGLKQNYYLNEFVRNYPKDKLVECDAVGFGAVMIKTSLLKKMKPPFFFSTTGAGEDIWFCNKAKKEANARIFMDTRIKLAHLGQPTIIDEKYRSEYVKNNNEKIDEEHLYNKYQ